MAGKNRRKPNSANGFHSQNSAPTSRESTVTPNEALSGPTTNGGGDNIDENENSPLKLFGEAKNKINNIYQRIDECIYNANQFYSKLDSEISDNVDLSRLLTLNSTIGTIRSVLSRDHMKVAFFGETSNGKSTVVNAILHGEILPMDCGHTTSCFLQIQGNHEDEAFIEVQGEKRPIKSVNHIANALNSGSLEYSALVRIYWPITRCNLLKHDVVLVDSPGVDVEDNVDDWIDKHCHDADVFVLVSNADSTLKKAEKNFFHKVSEKLSKPNIFILNNRWDFVASISRNIEQVREQHIERAVNFLSNELKIATPEEAKLKTFFVSAQETLQDRAHGRVDRNTHVSPGYEDRRHEFENFERSFEESLSKSAVRTKFKTHIDKAEDITQELDSFLTNIRSLAFQLTQEKLQKRQENIERCHNIELSFYTKEKKFNTDIRETREKIHKMIDCAFEQEIRRLMHVVRDFNDCTFSTKSVELEKYKERLYVYVEETLSENLRSKIQTGIKKHVDPFGIDMISISSHLKDERRLEMESFVRSQEYVQDELFNLMIDRQFQEDLEFRFSLGLVNIMRKFQRRSPSSKELNDSQEVRYEPQVSMSSYPSTLILMERILMNPPQSHSTIGSLAIGGVLVRTVGWRVIIITTVVYGFLYAYEYLSWTTSAKERSFKSQYVQHARRRLLDFKPRIIHHIAESVERKMNQTLKTVKEKVDAESSETRKIIGILDSSLERLEICDKFSEELLGQKNILLNELLAFASTFLNP